MPTKCAHMDCPNDAVRIVKRQTASMSAPGFYGECLDHLSSDEDRPAPHPKFIAHVAEMIGYHGGPLNAHRTACELRDLLADEPEHILFRHWQEVADEIVRQAQEIAQQSRGT